jgi:hypothetical protein
MSNKGVPMKFCKPVTLLIGVVLTLGSVFGLTGVAYADPGARRNLNTGRCIDDSFGSGLRSYGCNGLIFQQWHNLPTDTPNGMRWALRNDHTGRCIDDSFASGLRSYDCNGLIFQLWNFTWNPSYGAWVLTNEHTGRCIDDSPAFGLRSYGCNGLNYQLWADA